MNYFLVDTGKQKILFDTGLPLKSGGKITARLKEAGFSPTDIDIICITHMHGDHIGGLLDKKGGKLFPKARLFIAREEVRYWDSITKNNTANANSKDIQNIFFAYGNVLEKFAQNREIVPGVKSIPLFGHTPGHTGFEITSKNQTLLIWGDLTHAMVQFANPDIYLVYDIDPAQATKIRKSTLQKAASTNIYVAGMHIALPAVGKIGKTGKAYKFIPEI